jgi:phosphoglucomutase
LPSKRIAKKMLEQNIQSRVDKWLHGNYDAQTKAEIQAMNEEALNDAFYKDLEFGTGGMRGVMGAGTNRINRYTIGATTQAFANYLKKNFQGEQIKVVIAHDSRHNSAVLATVVADVFTANGIFVYAFMGIRPTPELSFAIRYLECHGGIMLTASHNPKEYNGFKAYWQDGAQVTDPHDDAIIEEFEKITSIAQINFEGNQDLIELIGRDIDEIYLNKICSSTIAKSSVSRQKNLKIVYTSLHGAGISLVPFLFKMMGFENVHYVESQCEPNGDFPTVKYPNPEEKEALILAIKDAEKINADVIMANDPDADRIGVVVKDNNGEFVLLNGNQTGTLIMAYLIRHWRQFGRINGRQMIVKTIVTTDLLDKIAQLNEVVCINTLTGFKHIAAVIRNHEGFLEYIAGCEESFGYMVGSYVRDKDGISACAIVAEMVAYGKERNQTLMDMLIEIYREYGFYLEDLVSITKKGMSGTQEIAEMMENFRNNPPKMLANSKVIKLLDYKTQIEHHLYDGTQHKIDLPKSNVLQFITEDGTKVSARPSGTEPKIKFYCSVNTLLPSNEAYNQTKKELEQKIKQVMLDLGVA